MNKVKILTMIGALTILSFNSVQAGWWTPKGKCRYKNHKGRHVAKHITEKECEERGGDWINHHRAIH